MMEIGGHAEFKIDFDSMSKIAYMLGRGRTILGETGPVLGGYAGGPEGCAVALAAYHFFALLVLRASVQHPFTSHFQTQSCTSRQAIWLRSLALQAITRHSDVPCLESGTYAAGPGTDMSLFEAAAMAAPSVASRRERGVGPHRPRHPPGLPHAADEPLRRRSGTVGGRHVPDRRQRASCWGCSTSTSDRLEAPPAGRRYQDGYDPASRRPDAETIAVYRDARAQLTRLGLEFKDPPFYA